MLKHSKLTERRIENAVEKIASRIYPERLPISVGAWHVGGEPVPYSVAETAEYKPFAVGDAWGPAWDTTWFRISGQIPGEWKDREPVVLFQLTDQGREGFTGEGLVYFDGQPVRAVNRARNEIPVPASKDGHFEFYLEGAANWAVPDGGKVAEKSGPLFFLTQAELAFINREAFDYYYDFKVAAEAMVVLPETGQRRAELRSALNESLNIWDEADDATIPAAREVLQEVLAKKNGDTVHKLSAIGHSHIDTAWLWPLRETIRKCARTFSTAIAYMESYPEYIFSCSQAQQYAWIKALYPSIYEKIKQRIKSGQWEPIGSMWVEVDCNLASGESLIRQILIGKKFFKEEFGYETRDAWVPDVFGYSAAMPQILNKCGIDAFVTQKISWSQFNKFPHHTFLWEGIDGTRIFTHFPPADTYNAAMSPQELVFNVTNFLEHGRASRSLYVYGHGDGGGGPDITMLEQAGRLRDFEGLPPVKQERVSEFLPKAMEDARDAAIWVGELYLELHRGTYTTQGATKRGNRKSEFLLRDAEFFDAVSRVLVPDREECAANPPHAVYDVTGLDSADSHLHARALDRAWKLLLLNQFHDIIPGSSIGWVYEDSAKDYQTITELGESVLAGSLKAVDASIDTGGLTSPVRVVNTLNWERREMIELPGGSVQTVTVPACGYALCDAAVEAPAPAAPVRVTTGADGGIELTNGLLRLRLGADGTIESLWDFEAGREVLAPGCKANVFQMHPDNPLVNDAWDVDIFYKERCQDLLAVDEISILESGPLLASVSVKRSFGSSSISQKIIMRAESRRIDFVTGVDWHESHKLLKVAFPVDVRSPQATYEIQFGHLQRPTHYNTSWDMARFEVCAHKWADLSEADYGVALLNDCKYGYDIHDNVMRLSLLRSPAAPDPKADRGKHVFTYSLLPHQGDFRAGRVLEEAYELNVPLRCEALTPQKGSLPAQRSYFSTDRRGVVIEAVKWAESGDGIIVRLYEAFGSRGPLLLQTSLPVAQVFQTDMLENEEKELAVTPEGIRLALVPFEILTLKLRLR